MDIRTLTPTLCRLMGINPPAESIAEVQEGLLSALAQNGIHRIDKCLIYAPDAIGRTIHEKHPDYFSELGQIICHSEFLESIDPPWTPVCFASMFSGTSPDIHGIKKYEKPVLTIDTLFDVMTRGGKTVAIAAVENSSIDLIFRNRNIGYFSEKYDSEVIERTEFLLEQNRYDLLVIYNQEYDDWLHRTSPYSTECLEALKHHNQSFLTLYKKIQKNWDGYNWLMVYAPDHGAHFDELQNRGTHGENIREDMNLIHHYIFPRRT